MLLMRKSKTKRLFGKAVVDTNNIIESRVAVSDQIIHTASKLVSQFSTLVGSEMKDANMNDVQTLIE